MSTLVNPVKRGRRVEFTIYSSRLEDEISGEKYTWICQNCGREWLMRKDARRCRHQDYVWYGQRQIFCLRKVEVVKR